MWSVPRLYHVDQLPLHEDLEMTIRRVRGCLMAASLWGREHVSRGTSTVGHVWTVLWTYCFLCNEKISNNESSAFFAVCAHTNTSYHYKRTPCGGGLEYLNRSSASRKRRRKGNWVPGMKLGHPVPGGDIILGPSPPGWGSHKNLDNLESHGTQTRKGLHWRGPAATVYYRPILTSERASQNKKPATF
jgi:hypothetical protein